MKKKKGLPKKECVVILHNIRSVHNVGSIFRTADAVGVSHIILSGYTPRPLDRFGRERKDFGKVSLGAEHTIFWSYTTDLAKKLDQLKRKGLIILAIEQDSRSVSLFDWKHPSSKPLAFLFGNEVRGLSRQLLGRADTILEIPLYGSKESLNVSVAAGIALFTVLKDKTSG